MQALAIDVELCKRSLSARPKASVRVVHAGRQKVYPVAQQKFEELSSRSRPADGGQITINMVREHALEGAWRAGPRQTHRPEAGLAADRRRPDDRWRVADADDPQHAQANQRIDAQHLALTGPIDLSRGRLLRGHAAQQSEVRPIDPRQRRGGAAGGGSSNSEASTRGRWAFWSAIRNPANGMPHYFLPANTQLPCASFVSCTAPSLKASAACICTSSRAAPSTRRGIHQAGSVPDSRSARKDLPEKSPIEVTISYDEQARVHVSAKDVASGKTARTEIVREENVVIERVCPGSLLRMPNAPPQVALIDMGDKAGARASDAGAQPASNCNPPPSAPSHIRGQRRARGNKPRLSRLVRRPSSASLDDSERLIPLCNDCAESPSTPAVNVRPAVPSTASHVCNPASRLGNSGNRPATKKTAQSRPTAGKKPQPAPTAEKTAGRRKKRSSGW